MKRIASIAVSLSFAASAAVAQDSAPAQMPPMPSVYGSPLGQPPGSTDSSAFPMQISPEILEKMKSQQFTPPPGFPSGPGQGSIMPPPGLPPTGVPGPNVEQDANAKKADRAAEKAREQMRQALRESAKQLQREREAEEFKGKKPKTKKPPEEPPVD